MKQTKLESALETAANISTGFIISMLMWDWVVQPLYDLGVINGAITITSIFTITSTLRGYFWRRFFNAGFHKAVNKFLSKRPKCVFMGYMWHHWLNVFVLQLFFVRLGYWSIPDYAEHELCQYHIIGFIVPFTGWCGMKPIQFKKFKL